jgi:hypothetical protein
MHGAGNMSGLPRIKFADAEKLCPCDHASVCLDRGEGSEGEGGQKRYSLRHWSRRAEAVRTSARRN